MAAPRHRPQPAEASPALQTPPKAATDRRSGDSGRSRALRRTRPRL